MSPPLTFKVRAPISVLMAPFFALYLAVGFELALSLGLLVSMSLALGVTIQMPTVAFGLVVTASLLVMWQNALSVVIPDVTLNLKLSFDFQAALYLALVAALEPLIAAFSAGVSAYAYAGTGAQLGSAVSADVGGGWVDGTSPAATVTAWLLVATSDGSAPGLGSVASCPLLAAPPPPPQPPTTPAIPASLYPPPQSYTAGLASVTFSAAPTGGTTATGTVSVDSSVATGVGKVTAINVTDAGEGYTSPPTPTISDASPLVSASVTTPIVLTLPVALTVPPGAGFACTVSGVLGSTIVQDASNAQPIVLTVPDAAGLVSCTVAGALGNVAANGQWYCQPVDATHVALYADPAFTLPSVGAGTYTPGSATLAGNVNGPHCANVLTPTTIALYADTAFTQPIAGYGTYAGGSVAGTGQGAVATATMGGGSKGAIQALFTGLRWPTAGLVGTSLTFAVLFGALFGFLEALLLWLQGKAKSFATASINFGVVPATVVLSLEFIAKIALNLTANLNVKPPSVSATASAKIGLNAQISVVANLVAGIAAQLSLGVGELEVYEYSGPGSQLGPAIGAAVGAGWHDGTPPSAPIFAVLIGATNPAAAVAFGVLFPGAA